MVICCQDCGIIIYWDDDMKEPVTAIDDMSRPPYVTAQGDLFCVWCGERYDEVEEEAEEDKYDFYYGSEEKKASEVVKSCVQRDAPKVLNGNYHNI